MTSPPPSPAMPKYKLAEYRYGREEMLALYIKDNKVSGKTLQRFCQGDINYSDRNDLKCLAMLRGHWW